MKASTQLPGLADRSSRLGTETAFDTLAEVNRLRAAGRDIISFGIGEPDFETPKNIVAAAKTALDDGLTRYGPSDGVPALRAAIAAEVGATRGISVDPEQVVVAPGAKPFILYSIATLVNEGEEVVYPNPGFPIYESVIRWLGAKPVAMALVEDNDFGCDHDVLASAVTDQTKLIILNSPNNPTGGVLTREDLGFIAELALRHNCWVLSDEVYSHLVFDGAFASIASVRDMQERTIIMDGFSKTYAMTGWRLGYGVMNAELARLMARIETNVESCTCAFTQAAGIKALTGPQDESRRFAAEFRRRASLTVELLNEIEGIHCVPPRGAFYAFPNVTAACGGLGLTRAEQLADGLLHEAGVAVLARSCFGSRIEGETDEYVRLSFATSEDTIREGIGRIKRYVEGAR